MGVANAVARSAAVDSACGRHRRGEIHSSRIYIPKHCLKSRCVDCICAVLRAHSWPFLATKACSTTCCRRRVAAAAFPSPLPRALQACRVGLPCRVPLLLADARALHLGVQQLLQGWYDLLDKSSLVDLEHLV
eukprot:216639-Chlamydomonas_euryale.AAC.1